jgi:hypothetical protein
VLQCKPSEIEIGKRYVWTWQIGYNYI